MMVRGRPTPLRDPRSLPLLLCPLRVRAGVCRLAQDSDIVVGRILAWDNELARRDRGALPEALQDEARRALLEFLDLL